MLEWSATRQSLFSQQIVICQDLRYPYGWERDLPWDDCALFGVDGLQRSAGRPLLGRREVLVQGVSGFAAFDERRTALDSMISAI